VLISAALFGSLQSFASCNASGAKIVNPNDTSVSAYMQQYLKNGSLMLSYPKSVERFYQAYGTEAAWVNQTDTKHTWQAMLLLDCVKLYGLSANDYHPKELLYDPLHTMIEEPARIANTKKAKFDILLTDAMITLMNNMHYGKLNPEYSSDKLDDGLALPFDAETALLNARQQEKFMTAIERAQPHSKEYTAMQDKLRQLKGVYQEDCYEIPEEKVAKIAINMERLRWAEIDTNVYIQVNIPSYTLRFVQPDTIYQFKVIVGKVTAQTPQLNSNIIYFTTFPEWKIPQKIFINELLRKALKDTAFMDNNHYSVYDRANHYIKTDRAGLLRIKQHPTGYYARQSSGCDNALGQLVFRFQNIYDIYLHDTPEQQLFKAEARPFSHSCVRVERAQQLAELMLKYEGDNGKLSSLAKAMLQRRTKNISLKSPIPIKITYLTCEVNEGQVSDYKDIYNLDKSLEIALFGTPQTLTLK
jgi:murein L,D-transpeptidase YcbB/YkuD